MIRFYYSFIIILLLLSDVSGQTPDKKQYKATRISTAPAINGILDEDAWHAGSWVDDFTQNKPYSGRAASQRTEFKILFDEDNLYVAIKAFDTSPDSIINRLTRRDEADGDQVGLIIDSYHDLRTGFLFGVSSSGVKYDQMITNDGQNKDPSWDPNWWVKTSINSEGWIAEMKIPFSQVRFEKNSGDVWGLEIARVLYRKNETSFWQHIPQDAPGMVHLFGEISGLEQIKPRKIFDITPYAVARTETFNAVPENPFLAKGKSSGLNGGIDAKIGVTNNLTMDLTINPDFGQVEADPSDVNLTAYETFFEEKRPFFIEGNNIINFGIGIGDGGVGNDNLFYSRRIGRRPQGSSYNYYGFNDTLEGYTNSPINTSIVGAAKLTGKTKNGLSIGFLNAVTAEEMAEIDTGSQRIYQTVEPLTNYMAGRIQKDFKEGNTIIGGMFTMVNRAINGIPIVGSETSNLKYRIPETAFTAGFDFTQFFKDKNYMFNTNAALSLISGTELAMVRAQRSSARYFQRPGSYVSLDSSRTSLSGNGGRMQFMKVGNGHWNYLAAFLWKTPGLELNDMGYLREADQLISIIGGGYNLWEPKSFYKSINLSSNLYSAWDFSGNHLLDGVAVNGNITFNNFWIAEGGTELNFNMIDNTMLRGGPIMKIPGRISSWLMINSDNRKKLVVEMEVNNTKMFLDGGKSITFSPELTYKPINTLALSINPSYTTSYDELQYVDQTNYGTQNRYIFASIDQKIISMSFRIDFNLSPDLSFQYWGQPFIASGKYSDFKYITNQMASEYTDRFSVYPADQIKLVDDKVYTIHENPYGTNAYAFDKPDFNFREFLSNLVVRWEYNPGSSVYLVWSQTRSSSDGSGNLDLFNDLGNLFDKGHNKPNNVFLVKFSYRFGLK
jgi:hypothetical protein